MTDAWMNFYLITSVALSIFFLIAYFCNKSKAQIIQLLGYGALTGLLIGVASDLFWGKFIGLWSYRLGFEVLPLVATAILIWGLFSASVLTMNELKFKQFFIWLMLLMLAYEISNYFLNVWTYEFELPFFGFLTFLILGNLAMASFIAGVWHFLLGKHFRFIDDLLRRF